MISLLSSALLLGSLPLINGQTFPGFIYQTSQELVVDYSGTVLNYSGEYLVKDQVQSIPTVGLKDQSSTTGPYLFIMIDPTPYGDNGTLNALHTIQTDLTLAPSSSPLTHISNTSFYELTSPKPPVAPYAAPDPTAGVAVHHYTQLLFRQPENYSIPQEFLYALPLNTSNITNRIAFSLPGFVDASKLGQPVAGNYFSLARTSSNSSGGSNGTAPTTTTASEPGVSGTASSSSSSSATSTSDAVRSFASSSLVLLPLGFVVAFWSVVV